MTDYKTNYFGSFLDAMKTPSGAAPGDLPSAVPAPPPAFPPSPFGVPAPPPGSDGGADAVLATLFTHGGTADVGDLLPHTGFSIDGLMSIIGAMHSFGFVTRTGSVVSLTPTGLQAAQAKLNV